MKIVNQKQFISHIESQFFPGMSWNNWGNKPGDWHIDHIAPLCSFDLSVRSQFLEACHYSNMQPLWRHDNFRKGGQLVAVPPQFTSQRCPKCDHVAKENRKSQSKFECVVCGYNENADVVGATNVLRAGQAHCGVGKLCLTQKQESRFWGVSIERQL